jgi:hypothetical protein
MSSQPKGHSPIVEELLLHPAANCLLPTANCQLPTAYFSTDQSIDLPLTINPPPFLFSPKNYGLVFVNGSFVLSFP